MTGHAQIRLKPGSVVRWRHDREAQIGLVARDERGNSVRSQVNVVPSSRTARFPTVSGWPSAHESSESGSDALARDNAGVGKSIVEVRVSVIPLACTRSANTE